MNKEQEEIARMILEYIRKHPDGKDTLMGITKWWLHLEKVEKSVNDVSIALESLIKDGILERLVIKGGNSIYKISNYS